jgi:hypothetical protein
MPAPRTRTMRNEVLMRSASPRTRQSTESSDVSTSSSPSLSVQSGISGTQYFQQTDSHVFAATPGTWSLNPSATRQHTSSFASGSIPLVPFNYVRDGIAPHEHVPSPVPASYPGTSSDRSIQQPIPRPCSPVTQGNDERCKQLTLPVDQLFSPLLKFFVPTAPSPRQLRLLSFQPFPSGELSE